MFLGMVGSWLKHEDLNRPPDTRVGLGNVATARTQIVPFHQDLTG